MPPFQFPETPRNDSGGVLEPETGFFPSGPRSEAAFKGFYWGAALRSFKCGAALKGFNWGAALRRFYWGAALRRLYWVGRFNGLLFRGHRCKKPRKA